MLDCARMASPVYIFMGRPGSGKGTQSELLAKKIDAAIFSTGKQFRAIAAQDSYLGRRVKQVIDAGILTPYWLAAYLFEDAILKLSPERSMVFEGVGRRLPEAKLFHEVMGWLERPYTVINIVVSEASILARLEKRKDIEGRADDHNIHRRIEEYNANTKPAIDYFRSVGRFLEVDGEPLPDIVHASVLSALRIPA